MAHYNYECTFCDHKFSKQEAKMSKRKAQYKCPECGTHNLVRLIGTGSMFKMDGVGFFKPGTSASNIH